MALTKMNARWRPGADKLLSGLPSLTAAMGNNGMGMNAAIGDIFRGAPGASRTSSSFLKSSGGGGGGLSDDPLANIRRTKEERERDRAARQARREARGRPVESRGDDAPSVRGGARRAPYPTVPEEGGDGMDEFWAWIEEWMSGGGGSSYGGGGAPMADYTKAFEEMRPAMEENLSRGLQDVREQSANVTGTGYGKSVEDSITEAAKRGELDINSILGKMAFDAHMSQADNATIKAMQSQALNFQGEQASLGREYGLIDLLMGTQNQGVGNMMSLGGLFQGLDQSEYDRIYSEWGRQDRGWMDDQLAFLGMGAPMSDAWYEGGWEDSILPILASFLGGMI